MIFFLSGSTIHFAAWLNVETNKKLTLRAHLYLSVWLFQIENAKVSKREQKIVQRFQKHAQRTAQAFEDERATRLSKFMLLSEDVDDNERWSDRTEEQRVRKVVAEVASMRKLLATQEAARAREDASLLDSMLYAQQQLQAAVLHSFGEGAKNTGEDD